MSDLPDTITVKRKRDQDGGALDYLCFEDYAKKRHKGISDNGKCSSVDWIYRRRKEVDLEGAENIPPQPDKGPAHAEPPGRPVIQRSMPGDENRPIKPLRHTKSVQDKWNMDLSPAMPAPAFLGEDIRNARRFHLTRSQPSLLTVGVIGSRVSKKRNTIFVERTEAARLGQAASPGQRDSKPRKAVPVELATFRDHGDYRNSLGEVEAALVDMQTGHDKTSAPASSPPTNVPRARKRPGARARIPTSQQKLPPSLLNRQNAGIHQLTQEMDAFALEQVSQNLARIDEDKKEEQARAARAAAKPQFRPRGQALGQRIFERDSTLVAQLEKKRTGTSAARSGDVDVDMDTSDDDDYVLETYVRVPASQLTEAVQPHQMGLLVFDTEPDRLDFFYGNEEESEDEVPEDGDDENAEGHYSTEYPDEDLEWDDEMGQSPYRYLTQNAADLEEFDEDAFLEQAWDKDAVRTVEDNIMQRTCV